MSEELISIAKRLAEAGGKAALTYFRGQGLTADNKSSADFDPVTEGDRAAEQAMRAILAAERPQDGILGEEFGQSQGESGWVWVLDPIDGTRGFLAGTPVWGVLVGLRNAQGPQFGIIEQPFIGERFFGGLGEAGYTGPRGNADLKTRSTTKLSDAILFSTFPEVGSAAEAEAFHKVSRQAKLTRYGCDCYAYGLLALGQIDLVIEAGLHAYDIVAPIAVVEAAGGVITNWSGESAAEGGRVVAAATPELHQAALELLSQCHDEEFA